MSHPLIFTGIFLALTVLLALALYGIGAAIKRQAQKPEKRYFAPIPRPGSFSFVTLEGKVVDIIESVVGWRLEKILDGNKCFVPQKKEEPENLFRYLLEHFLGVVWIGLFATIKIFEKWKWSEFKQVETEEKGVKTPKFSIVGREESVTDFFFQFPYPVIVEDVEIKGNIRVKIVAVLTVLHLYPARAFFLNKDPVALFNAMIQSSLRSYVKDKDFDSVKAIKASADQKGDEEKTFWDVLKKLNGIEFGENGPDYTKVDQLGLFGKLGYAVVRAEVIQIETIGETADALEAQRLAELRGDADIAKAQKAAQALIVAAQGRMEAAKRDALAQRMLNEQNAGYYASLPGGARMFAAAQVSNKDSSVATWVEGGNDMKVALPLPPAPSKPKEPEKI